MPDRRKGYIQKAQIEIIKFICIPVNTMMVNYEIFIDTNKEGELVKAMMNNFASYFFGFTIWRTT